MRASRRALVTGAGGQDGYYLAALLNEKGYEVFGCGRPGSLMGSRLEALRQNGIEVVDIDLSKKDDVVRAMRTIEPDEIYNLAGSSFVPTAWDDPAAVSRDNLAPLLNLLAAVQAGHGATRICHASTAEVFSGSQNTPQSETTPLAPATAYGALKAAAHLVADVYRNQKGLFVACPVLFNHESPRRSEVFVTRKVTLAVARIVHGMQHELNLGDLDSTRDWGYAPDYVDAMWRILQAPAPVDYVIGTGVGHTVRQLCEMAFSQAGLDYREYVRSEPSLVRPVRSEALLADSSRARVELGWLPTTDFESLIRLMVDADLRLTASAIPSAKFSDG